MLWQLTYIQTPDYFEHTGEDAENKAILRFGSMNSFSLSSDKLVIRNSLLRDHYTALQLYLSSHTTMLRTPAFTKDKRVPGKIRQSSPHHMQLISTAILLIT